jgi:hypothetical protein
MQFQALPGSPLPDQLRQLGWRVERTGTSERILPHAVRRRFEVSSSGALTPATENSTRPTSIVVTQPRYRGCGCLRSENALIRARARAGQGDGRNRL